MAEWAGSDLQGEQVVRGYAKLDYDILETPALVDLDGPPYGLYCAGLAYCARLLTDGLIPHKIARQICTRLALRSHKRCITTLLDLQLWERRDASHYVVVGWKNDQMSRSDVEAKKADGRNRTQKWRANIKTGATGDASPRHIEQEQEPEQDNREEPPSVRASRAQPIPSRFPVTPGMAAWASKHAHGIDIESETLKFVDYARTNGRLAKDWVAAWRNWMRKAVEFKKEHAPATSGRRLETRADSARRTTEALTMADPTETAF
jgi:hypothetical protein